MSKIAMVYRSKSGFTEKYAKWIAEAAGAELLKGDKIKAEDLMKYDTIVYGGGLYAVGINGVRLITENYELLKEKKLIVFGLGASPVRPEIYEEVKNKNLTIQQQETIDFFLLRGGFNKEKLTTVDRILMQLMKLHLKRKKNPTPDERGMLNAYEHPVDFTDRSKIQPILDKIL